MDKSDINNLCKVEYYNKVDVNPYELKEYIIYLEQEQYNPNIIKDIIKASSKKFGENWQIKIADEIYSIVRYLLNKYVIDKFGETALNDYIKLKEILKDLEDTTEWYEMEYLEAFNDSRHTINSFKNFLKYNFKTIDSKII